MLFVQVKFSQWMDYQFPRILPRLSSKPTFCRRCSSVPLTAFSFQITFLFCNKNFQVLSHTISEATYLSLNLGVIIDSFSLRKQHEVVKRMLDLETKGPSSDPASVTGDSVVYGKPLKSLWVSVTSSEKWKAWNRWPLRSNFRILWFPSLFSLLPR